MNKKPALVFLIGLFASSLIFAQYGQYSSRALLKKSVYFITQNQIKSASYWSMPLGSYECKLKKEFPGEGVVEFNANVNFALLSSGYIEGKGYGSRGKVSVEGELAIKQNDSLRSIELDTLDYVYMVGKKAKLKDGRLEDLYLVSGDNSFRIKKMDIMTWKFDKTLQELKHFKDFERLVGFSYTKDGARRALQAQKDAHSDEN